MSKPLSKNARQMVQALLMSEHIKTGQDMYEIISKKIEPDKFLASLKDPAEKIFFAYVLKGDLQNALSTANDDNKLALERKDVLQKLQSLLACKDRVTAKLAFNILSGLYTFEKALNETVDPFMKALLSCDKSCMALASEAQADAIELKVDSKIDLQFNTPQNLHRLHYIMFDQQLNKDQVLNVMMKAFYETIRADDYAELLGDDYPQNYFI